MQCECCGEKEANVHLTQVVNQKVLKVHLCSACAQQSGIDIKSAMPFADMLFETELEEAVDGVPGPKVCPACRMRIEDIRKNSRLGCSVCYERFEKALLPILASIHKSTRHVGKAPRIRTSGSEVETMHRRLDDAIASQNFEEAAAIRDLIHVVKEGGTSAKTAKRKREP